MVIHYRLEQREIACLLGFVEKALGGTDGNGRADQRIEQFLAVLGLVPDTTVAVTDHTLGVFNVAVTITSEPSVEITAEQKGRA